MRSIDLIVTTLRYIGWEPFTGMGRMKCVPELNGRIDLFIVACSADSVIVIEVRWQFIIFAV